jgi:hypothetical protein
MIDIFSSYYSSLITCALVANIWVVQYFGRDKSNLINYTAGRIMDSRECLFRLFAYPCRVLHEGSPCVYDMLLLG